MAEGLEARSNGRLMMSARYTHRRRLIRSVTAALCLCARVSCAALITANRAIMIVLSDHDDRRLEDTAADAIGRDE